VLSLRPHAEERPAQREGDDQEQSGSTGSPRARRKKNWTIVL
jgi:hypothetical protein